MNLSMETFGEMATKINVNASPTTDSPSGSTVLDDELGCAVTITRLVYISVPLLVTITCLMNAVALITLLRIPKGVDATNHILVATLALIGFVVPLLVLISWMGSYAVCGMLGGNVGCFIIGWIISFLYVWYPQIVAVISIMRFLAVAKPLIVKTGYMSGKKTIYLLGILLLYSMLLTIHPFFTGPRFHFYRNIRFCGMDFAPGRGNNRVHRAILGSLAVQGIIMIVISITCNIFTVVKVGWTLFVLFVCIRFYCSFYIWKSILLCNRKTS